MKKYISLPFIVAVTLLFVGCKKEDGFIAQEYLEKLEAVPAISTKINATGSQAIDLLNISTFSGKFDVTSYFPTSGVQPSKVDIVVRKNGSNTNVRLYKAGVTTLPQSYTITAAEIAALFGTPIVLGDSYDFAADLYMGDKKYEAFPITGVGSSPGPINMIGYSEFARFAAICAYNPSIYQGNFVVVSDGWGDYAPGDVVVITQVSPTSFSFTYPADGPQPIIVRVNTANNVTSVVKQVYGTGGYPPGWPYGPISVESVSGNTANIVSPCAKEFSVRLTHTVAAGSFGSYTIRMRKQ